jgi:hypothetical protein
VVGLAGGFGWLFSLNEGAPKELKIMQTEVLPDTPLLFSVQYPVGTSVSVIAKGVDWCWSTCDYPCEEIFQPVDSVEAVRNSPGNVYHLDPATGLLTVRIVMYPELFTGSPDWKLYNFNDVGRDGNGFALNRFERKGVLLPRAAHSSAFVTILADCDTTGTPNNAYCSGNLNPNVDFDSAVCSPGFVQVSYDRCCQATNLSNCEYPYSWTAPPTLAPGSTLAPTARNPEVIDNGDFEKTRGGTGVICPWDTCCGVVLSLQQSNIFGGSSTALSVTGRTATWQGPGQDILGKFQFGVPYNFKGYVYPLVGGTLRLDVSISAGYEESTCNDSYFTVFTSSSITGQTVNTMTRNSYTLSSASLRPGCTLDALRLYVQTPNFVYNFLLDGLSLKES